MQIARIIIAFSWSLAAWSVPSYMGVVAPRNFGNALCDNLTFSPHTKSSIAITRHNIAQGPFREVIDFTIDGVDYPFNLSISELTPGFLLAARFDCTEKTNNQFILNRQLARIGYSFRLLQGRAPKLQS